MNTFWMVFTGTLAVGWGTTAAYAEYRRRRRERRRQRYLEGLRFLLDDKPERALEVFLSLAANDDETIDTHFALGSLYRRRGEVDRAILVHQHLVERPGIDPRYRDAAKTELARDYVRAGLYDRAEKLLLELADGGLDPGAALALLVRIYELQHDWAQAAAVHDRLRATGVPDQPVAVAHYHCELAEASIAERDFTAAREHLRRAREAQRDFGRSAILRGDLARLQGDPQLAAQLYRRVVRRDFHLLALVLPRLADAAKQAGSPEAFSDALADLVQNGLASRSEIAYAAIVGGYYDDPVILGCVREWLEADHDLKDITGALLPAGTEPSVEQLRAVAGAMRNVVLRHARYRCSECGLDSSSFLWQCPGCKSWDTLRGIAALEFMPRAARPRSPSYPTGTVPLRKIGDSPRWGQSPIFCANTFLFRRRRPRDSDSVSSTAPVPGAAGKPKESTMKKDHRTLIQALVATLLPFGAWAGPVNVNTADASTLAKELEGIGPAKAEAIVEYRQKNGPFRAPEDLLKVQGIGERVLEQNRANLRFSGAGQAPAAGKAAPAAPKPAAKR